MKHLIIPIMLLTGCTSVVPAPQEVPKIHPQWPAPVQSLDVKWKVINKDGPQVALSYKESQGLRIWLEDVKRYLQQMKTMVCYYRVDLNEPKCENYDKSKNIM